LAYNGDVKLTDFGLARSVLKEEHTQPGVVFGRAAYLAPEQARGEVADPRTDVYSLGVVLWELLTGHPYLQIAGLDPAAALSLVRHPKPTPPSTRAAWITPALDAAVMKALTPDRNHRYQTAEEFRLALSDVIAESAPHTDATRVAELMNSIYPKIISEEREERDQFIKSILPTFRARCTPPPFTLPIDTSSSHPMAHPPLPPSSELAQPPINHRTQKREAAMKVIAELAKENGVS
jgi:serine/threonine-protein kinase